MPSTKLKKFNDIELFDEPLNKVISIIKEKNIPGLSYIVTPNADHFYRLDNKENSEFIEAYENADLRICDSRIIQKLSIIKGNKIRNVIPGSDLTKAIISSEWAKKLDLLIVGPEQHEINFIKEKFRLPTLKSYTPPMGFIRNDDELIKCINAITEARADIVFLAVGSPQQELLAYRTKKLANEKYQKNTVMLCVGASFDFLSGKTSRAPVFFQKLHLEWFHRALSNPKRLIPRYWNNFLWIFSYIFNK